MKSHWILCITAVLLLSAASDAALTVVTPVPGQTVTYDDMSGFYWYWNILDFVDMTYDDQLTAIGSLGSYAGHPGWHMASEEEMHTLWANTPEAVFSSFPRTINLPGVIEVTEG